MAYSYQTWTFGQVATSTEMQQLEDNVRDHTHGSSGVNANFVSFTGSALVADISSFNNLNAVLIHAHQGFIDNTVIGSATPARASFTFSAVGSETINGVQALRALPFRTGSTGGFITTPTYPVTWTVSRIVAGTYLFTHSLQSLGYTVLLTNNQFIDYVLVSSKQANRFMAFTYNSSISASDCALEGLFVID